MFDQCNDRISCIVFHHECPKECTGKEWLKDNHKIDMEDYHTRCADCGQMLKMCRWVSIHHIYKKHALCGECLSGYDDPSCL